MASAEEYAQWIVDNAGKRGTPEFDTVAQAYSISKNQPAAPSAPTAAERGNAFGGGLARGVAGVAGLPVDTVENVLNLGIAGYGAAKQALTGRPGPDLIQGSLGGSESIAKGMEKVGMNASNPRPDDPASRMLYTGGVVLGGAPNARSAVPAVAGAVAGETLGPNWVVPAVMAPGAARQAGAALKASVANPETVQRNQQAFAEAGTKPDVAQATESNFLRGLTNVVSRLPGGQSVIAKFREGQQQDLGGVRTGATAEQAGRAIKEGVTGEGGFMGRFKATQEQLYGQLDRHIAPDTRIDVNRTRTMLESLNSDIPGAPNLSKWFKNSRIQGIEGSFKADTETPKAALTQRTSIEQSLIGELPPAERTAIANELMDGKLPYEAVKKLRTLVGRELADSTIASDVPKSKWKALYAAISDDLGSAAKASGPGATQAWQRANSYTRAGMDRIENTLNSVIGDGKTFEAIFKGASPTNIDDVNKIRGVMRSLDSGQREIVSNALIEKLGRTTPGKQDDAGSRFSSETFLTNWNRINPSAKSQLFPDQGMRMKLDAVARVASDVRDSQKVFANPSGTAGAVGATGVYASPVVALGAMSVAPLVAAGTLLAGANIGAKMLTSPRVVDWLARTSQTKTPLEATRQLAQLSVIYNETKDAALKDELGAYINSVGKTTKAINGN